MSSKTQFQWIYLYPLAPICSFVTACLYMNSINMFSIHAVLELYTMGAALPIIFAGFVAMAWGGVYPNRKDHPKFYQAIGYGSVIMISTFITIIWFIPFVKAIAKLYKKRD